MPESVWDQLDKLTNELREDRKLREEEDRQELVEDRQHLTLLEGSEQLLAIVKEAFPPAAAPSHTGSRIAPFWEGLASLKRSLDDRDRIDGVEVRPTLTLLPGGGDAA
jgi:hypothetical protein